jgi:hypothetical protein
MPAGSAMELRAGVLIQENSVTSDEVAELCSTVGNLVRIALVIELEEAQAARDIAAIAPLESALIDPWQTPSTRDDHVLNCRLLAAFVRFRSELESIRGESIRGPTRQA